MAIYVNTNASAMRGRNQLNAVNNKLDTTYQRLSSGLRINSAKDDAAGLAISDRMTSQINGLQQGNRNAADGIALLQTMEGAMDEIGSSLQQVRTLMVQAANGTNTADDKKALGNQIVELMKGIDDVATTTKFGGKTILNGGKSNDTIFGADSGAEHETGTITLQIGANGGDTLSINVSSLEVNENAAGILKELKITKGGLVDSAGDFEKLLFKMTTGAATTADSFKTLIGTVDKAIQALDGERANLGANQNRLEATIRNQENVIANQSDARSRIRDTDFAEESAKLSQQNIIQQAAMSMLMQANARPQLALSMLG